MYPGFGPQKVEMNKRTGSAVPSKEYEAMKRSMLQQDAQSMAYKGAGQVLENNRDPLYGNVQANGTDWSAGLLLLNTAASDAA